MGIGFTELLVLGGLVVVAAGIIGIVIFANSSGRRRERPPGD